jgi:hypothetical protein
MNHILKIWPQYYEPLLEGDKTFEVRQNDRGFQRGDALWFVEVSSDEPHIPTGRRATATVSYVHSGLGMDPGYVSLGLRDVEEFRP